MRPNLVQYESAQLATFRAEQLGIDINDLIHAARNRNATWEARKPNQQWCSGYTPGGRRLTVLLEFRSAELVIIITVNLAEAP